MTTARVLKYTATEKHREAVREVEMRKSVYPTSRLNAHTARKRIEIMQEIADDYAALAEKERLL